MPQSSCGPPSTQHSSRSPTRYSAPGSETGKDRSITAWIREKIAVVPPIPSASVRMAVAVNMGASLNWRRAYRMLPARSRMWTPYAVTHSCLREFPVIEGLGAAKGGTQAKSLKLRFGKGAPYVL
jgi:hypothetical protein